MATSALRHVLDAHFRANPDYEVVLFDRLPAHEQAALAGLREDPELYGICRPRTPGLGLKSLSRDAALLLLTLREPGPLPAYVRALLEDGANTFICQLVLDGLLELETEGGHFVSGTRAHAALYHDRTARQAAGLIERLSAEAIHYGARLEELEPVKLSARLYFFNRLPVTPRWRRELPDEAAVATWLGLEPGGRNHRLLDRHWRRLSPNPGNEGWLIWRREPVRSSARLAYKLYISPHPGALHEAFRGALEVLTEMEAPHFKVARDVYGLLRPDKLVVYLPTFDALAALARALAQRLEGTPVHGVPFTSELAGHGLLSWGMDPPSLARALPWLERPSWRLWVTNALAIALSAARAQPSQQVEPERFALDRLRLEGVDTVTWTPLAPSWGREREGAAPP